MHPSLRYTQLSLPAASVATTSLPPINEHAFADSRHSSYFASTHSTSMMSSSTSSSSSSSSASALHLSSRKWQDSNQLISDIMKYDFSVENDSLRFIQSRKQQRMTAKEERRRALEEYEQEQKNKSFLGDLSTMFFGKSDRASQPSSAQQTKSKLNGKAIGQLTTAQTVEQQRNKVQQFQRDIRQRAASNAPIDDNACMFYLEATHWDVEAALDLFEKSHSTVSPVNEPPSLPPSSSVQSSSTKSGPPPVNPASTMRSNDWAFRPLSASAHNKHPGSVVRYSYMEPDDDTATAAPSGSVMDDADADLTEKKEVPNPYPPNVFAHNSLPDSSSSPVPPLASSDTQSYPRDSYNAMLPVRAFGLAKRVTTVAVNTASDTAKSIIGGIRSRWTSNHANHYNQTSHIPVAATASVN